MEKTQILEMLKYIISNKMNIEINKLFVNVGDFRYRNTLNYQQIIRQLESVEYYNAYSSIGGMNAKDERVERGPFAPFVVVFYALFVILHRIPTPQEVWEYYSELYCTDLGNGYSCLANGFSFRTNDLYGRIARAYCSWCRELTLLYALFDVLPFGFVPKYRLDKDMHGVDVVIYHKGHIFNIHSYLRRAKSIQYRNEKNSRYDVEAGVHMDVAADFGNTRLVGDISVHGFANAENLLNDMLAYEAHHA